MYDKDLKEKVKAYYESHYEDAKMVAEIFDVHIRTLRHWIQQEKWQQGRILQENNPQDLQEKIMQTSPKEAKKELSEKLQQGGLSPYVADEISEEMVFKACSQDFINDQMLRAALIGNQAFKACSHKTPDSPKMILYAKEVVNIWDVVKKSVFGKEASNPNVVNFIQNVADFSHLSDEQLRQLLVKKEEE